MHNTYRIVIILAYISGDLLDINSFALQIVEVDSHVLIDLGKELVFEHGRVDEREK